MKHLKKKIKNKDRLVQSDVFLCEEPYSYL